MAAVDAAHARRNSGGSGGGMFSKLLSRDKAKSLKDVFLMSVPPVEASPDFARVSQNLTLPSLVCCMHSLSLLAGGVPAIAASAAQRWADQQDEEARHFAGVATGGGSGGVGCSPSAGPSPLGGRAAAARLQASVNDSVLQLQAAVDATCDFIAAKITYWDLRQEWLEQLYRHHVSNQRIDVVHERLTALLRTVCGPMRDEVLMRRFARSLLSRSAQAYERVLLDGGPCRWFIPSDVPTLEDDLSRLGALFFSDGAGLPRSEVDMLLSRPRSLLAPMALEAGPLMDLVKEAKARGSCSMRVNGANVTFAEPDVVRLLARRPERTSSKLLKELYRMPKKLSLQMASAPPRGANGAGDGGGR